MKHLRDTSTLMMEVETVSNMLDINSILTQLIMQEDINYNKNKGSQS